MGKLHEVIGELGGRQGGALTRGQLLGAGISRSAIDRAVAAGHLHVCASGVLVANGVPDGRWRSLWVAHLAAGPRSAVARWSAASQWSLDGVRPSPPTVLVPHACSPTDEGIVVHRTRKLDALDIVTVGGLPFTTPARTVVDLAAECRIGRLGMLVDSAHHSGRARYEEVGQTLLRLGCRGRPGAERLLRLLDDRSGDPLAASHLEQLLAGVLFAAGVPLGHGAFRQHPLPSQGEVVGTVDVYLPDSRVVVEADGRRWHERQLQMKRDRERDFAAAQVGVMTVRLMHEHLVSDPDGCAAGLRQVIASRPRVLGA